MYWVSMWNSVGTSNTATPGMPQGKKESQFDLETLMPGL